jgi:protease PrsW
MDLIGFGLSILLGFVPMFFLAAIMYWLDRYEKEPKHLLVGAFAWGAIIAVIGALVLQLAAGQLMIELTRSEMAEEIASASLFAPITEEILKGMAVFLIFVFFRHEFDSILDGIVYAAITALGFAATEDALYYFGAYMEGGIGSLMVLFFLRFIIFGWQHAFFTSFIGIGLAITRQSRDMLVKILAPVVGLSLAIFVHSLHNSVLTLIPGLGGLAVAIGVAWFGWLGMSIFIIWMVVREKRWLAEYLREEVNLGVISQRQYDVVCSIFGQTKARFAALASGRYRSTNQFFQLCGELSHKKRQLAAHGDESGNTVTIASLRSQLNQLSQGV